MLCFLGSRDGHMESLGWSVRIATMDSKDGWIAEEPPAWDRVLPSGGVVLWNFWAREMK